MLTTTVQLKFSSQSITSRLPWSCRPLQVQTTSISGKTLSVRRTIIKSVILKLHWKIQLIFKCFLCFVQSNSVPFSNCRSQLLSQTTQPLTCSVKSSSHKSATPSYGVTQTPPPGSYRRSCPCVLSKCLQPSAGNVIPGHTNRANHWQPVAGYGPPWGQVGILSQVGKGSKNWGKLTWCPLLWHFPALWIPSVLSISDQTLSLDMF